MNHVPAPIGPDSNHVRSIVFDIILTLLTFGFFNLYVQYVQMKAVNVMIGEKKYTWFLWFFLSIITFGLYHIYHEYRKSSDIARALNKDESIGTIINLMLTIFGLHIVADAIQQSEINDFFGSREL
jgi:hypothetical protein